MSIHGLGESLDNQTLKSNSKAVDKLIIKIKRLSEIVQYLDKNSDLVEFNPEDFDFTKKIKVKPTYGAIEYKPKAEQKQETKAPAKAKLKKQALKDNILSADMFNLTELCDKYMCGNDNNIFAKSAEHFEHHTLAKDYSAIIKLAEATAEWLKTVDIDNIDDDNAYYIITRRVMKDIMDKTGIYSPSAYYNSVLFINDVAKAYYDFQIRKYHSCIMKNDLIRLQNKIKNNKNAA